ncbi:hypothetical protein WN48_02314 [Eufriesea mexicana]|uniref:Uncharacterized protein n=1 Tax=Eufriesea mexicana TaxID=516756 RepID=A0A310SKH5_9HYME|nr:hypothetical protein WN48_02314 [Eufriesea mexicana]
MLPESKHPTWDRAIPCVIQQRESTLDNREQAPNFRSPVLLSYVSTFHDCFKEIYLDVSSETATLIFPDALVERAE